MRRKSAIIIIGALITALGIGMFIFAGSIFTYQGPPLSDIVSKLGMYSFVFWIPVLAAGIAIFIVGVLMKRKPVRTDPS